MLRKLFCALFSSERKKNLHQVQLKYPHAPGALGSEMAYSPYETLDLSQVASSCALLPALVFQILGVEL